MWLLKPTFLNWGWGIHIFTELNQMDKIITDYYIGYLEKPLEAVK